MKRFSVKNLDVGMTFTVPLSNGGYAVGTIIENDGLLYICIYDRFFITEPLSANDIDFSKIRVLLVGRTGDALFYHRRWSVIGILKEIPNVPYPCHVVDSQSGLVLKKFHGELVRCATDEDLAFYGYETSYSNITFAKLFEILVRNVVSDIDPASYKMLLIGEAQKRVCDEAA